MFQVFDKVHKHANDLFKVRGHQVEQYKAVFAPAVKQDSPISISTNQAYHFVGVFDRTNHRHRQHLRAVPGYERRVECWKYEPHGCELRLVLLCD